MMRLRLTVTNSAHSFAEHIDAWEFTEAGGTIGRSSSNDWVLPDPKKILSGHHAEIRCEDGAFAIVDLGTNGVFLNGSEFRVGKGCSAALRNGDRFRMGDFEILAEIETGGLAPWPEPDRRAHDTPLIPDNFNFFSAMGGSEADRIPDSHGSIADLGRLMEPPVVTPQPQFADGPVAEFPKPLLQQPEQWLPESLGNRAATSLPDLFPEQLSEQFPLRLDERFPEPIPDRLAERSPPPLPEFTPPRIAEPTTAPIAPEADADADADADAPPTNPTLPWDLGAPTVTEVSAPPATHAFSPVPAASASAAPDFDTSWVERPLEVQDAARDPRPASAASASRPPPERAASEWPVGDAPRMPPRASGAPNPQPVVDAGPAPADTQAPDGLDAALSYLLAGAGVPDLKIPGGATPEFFQNIGAIIGIYASASAELMRAISEIKNTFHINVTLVRNHDNNPLRWATPRQAVKRLLAPEGDEADLVPTVAAADAMDRVMAHQMGVLKGMEAAFKSFVHSLDPEGLERLFEAQGSRGLLTNKRAWYWEQYAKHYAGIAEDAGENYLVLLGDTYAKAYETHVRAIREKAAAERAEAARG